MKYDDIENQSGKRLTLRQKEFFGSSDAVLARAQLKLMDKNPRYNTCLLYFSSKEEGLSFVNKHMLYLSTHPTISVQQYISNLKLKSKILV